MDSEFLKFLTEFRKAHDTFLGHIVSMGEYERLAKEEENETVKLAFTILMKRRLALARSAWMDFQTIEHKFMAQFD